MTRPQRPARARTRAALLIAVVGLALTSPLGTEAQVRRGRTEPPTPPWSPISIGVRGGWEQEQLGSGSTLGAAIHLPVVRDGRFEVVPSFDAIWVRRLPREYQYNLDVVFVPGGRRGGVFIGGGLAWRESLVAGVADDVERKTYTGYNIVLGGKNQIGPVQIVLGLRWALLNDTSYDPNALSLGLALPLWSALPPRP